MRTDHSRHLDFALPLDLALLSAARHRVRAFLEANGVDERNTEELVLCAQEALKNSVRFSGSRRAIDVHVGIALGAVSLVVRDYGVGLDGATGSWSSILSRPPDPLAASGRGFFMMATLMDELQLHSDGGLEVRMWKRLRGDERRLDGPAS